MMGMSEHDDKEKCEQDVRAWLEKNEIPYERYVNLSPSDKVVLHNLVCTRDYPASDLQLRDLYRNLVFSATRVKGYPSAAVDSMTNAGLKKFFTPLTPSERLHDLEKY